jgi:1L-myo-inositol 1-phosphate cytidylyltransferase / CDP-L-myo-inositol myo-inositolphosphotransferase
VKGRSALVAFESGALAGRRIAGVAAAARIVREIAEAGFDAAWLALPPGQDLDAAAGADVRRLAGTMPVRIVAADAPVGATLRLPADRLVTAAVLREMAGGAPLPDDAGLLRLDGPRASATLLRSTGKAGDGPVSRWLNRPLSRALSALLLRVPGIRPLHATLGTALLAGLMFAALVLGGQLGLIAGALLFQAASIFDGVDGELARATFRASRAGALLDSVVDATTNLLFVAGLAFNLAASGNEQALPVAGWGFVLFVLGLVAITWRSARAAGPFSLDAVKHDYRGRFSGRLVARLIETATVVSSRDFFALLFALLILAGVPMAVLYVFAAAATIWILFVCASLRLGPKPEVVFPSA